MVQAVGPVYTGQFEEIAVMDGNERYHILYLPDKHNDDLQRAGKAPVYYWMPKQVRIARKGDIGDYKFHLLHFVGVQDESTHVGVQGHQEVTGGVLSVTTTAAPPLKVLQKAHNQVIERFRGDDRRYWGWRTPATPQFAPVPISSNITSITNLSPTANGTIPAANSPAPAPDSGNGAPPTGRQVSSRSAIEPRLIEQPRTVPFGKAFRAPSNLDAWYWNLQGQGPGSIDPAGENAFSGLLGSLPTAILWQGFHGTYSNISVIQALKIKVWSQSLRLVIKGNWEWIFKHFSAQAKGRAWWFSADIKVELNKLMINGGIEVQLEIDGTVPHADKLRDEANKRIDLIMQKFMDQAQKVIFDPAPPDVKPAEASGGGGILSSIFGGFGGGFALKYRRDEKHLNLSYEEVVDERYLMDHVISSTLEGFYNEIKKDPTAEKKYFTTLYLDDWDRKVTRIIKPVVNWPDPSKKWVGEPVAFLSVSLGYPSARGDIQWTGHVFQSTDTSDMTTWQPAFSMKNADDVANAPAGWTPDKTFVKRMVHLTEPPGETDYPFMRVFVEKNVIELDPGENGSLLNDQTLEVRADSVGKLEVGPIALNVVLEDAKQFVEVEFQALGKTIAGNPRPITRFSWKFTDQEEPRYWEIFTGQPDFIPQYKYRVHVVIKGSLFSKGMEWYGPWQDGAGNGPLMISVPTPDDEGVTTRRLSAREIATLQPGTTLTLPAFVVEEQPAAPTPEPVPVGEGMMPPPSEGGAPPARRRQEKASDRTVEGYNLTSPDVTTAVMEQSAERSSKVGVPLEQELELLPGWSAEEPVM